METYLHIKEGEITNLKALLQLAKPLNGYYLCKLENKRKRSLPQNAYFHGPVLDLVKDVLRECGWNWIKTKGDAKKWLKNEFLKVEMLNEKTGELMPIVRDTHELTTLEFNEFLEDIARWLGELGIELPPPGGQQSMFNDLNSAA
jgi:hypothetical protein